jgi:hypothetical protein
MRINEGDSMNERIKQITGQVLDEIVPYTWTTLGYDKIKEIQNRTAELIVRECVNKCDFVAAMAEITNTGEMARKTKATANS